jgi:hypothetical protein
MRVRPETILIVTMATFAFAGVTAVAIEKRAASSGPDPVMGTIEVTPGPIVSIDDANAWFQSIRRYCNPVDVETRLRWQPAPGSEQGTMHEAACLALAGKIDRARGVIESLPQARRYEAAGVVFNTGHPAADAGDELAAGPLMELVVEFWPNHYMALYHAGASAFERGETGVAEGYLERFLVEYSVEDGWRTNALTMLEQIDS